MDTNIVLLADADPNRGVLYDAHEANASRRYKAFGSFWSNLVRLNLMLSRFVALSVSLMLKASLRLYCSAGEQAAKHRRRRRKVRPGRRVGTSARRTAVTGLRLITGRMRAATRLATCPASIQSVRAQPTLLPKSSFN